MRIFEARVKIFVGGLSKNLIEWHWSSFWETPLPFGNSDIKLWGLTPPIPTLIVRNEDFHLNLKQKRTLKLPDTFQIRGIILLFTPQLNSNLTIYATLRLLHNVIHFSVFYIFLFYFKSSLIVTYFAIRWIMFASLICWLTCGIFKLMG